MCSLVTLLAAAALLAPNLVSVARAAASEAVGTDATLCEAAISEADHGAQIPAKLLEAIGLVESGRPNPATRRVLPWPWTINVQGQGYFFGSQAEAVAAVEALLARGIQSIDVGCMQINLLYHPEAFASPDQAFDPKANVAYAMRFLNRLYREANNWPAAVAAYHSQTPELAADYRRRVIAVWPLAPRFAEPPRSMAFVAYTPEFARKLAQDATDRAVRNAMASTAAGRSAAQHSRAATLLPARGHTRTFASEIAQSAAAREARIAAMRGDARPWRSRRATAPLANRSTIG